MNNADLRHGLHTELIQYLEGVGLIGDEEDESEADDDAKCGDDECNDDEYNDAKCDDTKCDDSLKLGQVGNIKAPKKWLINVEAYHVRSFKDRTLLFVVFFAISQ
jgi:hypothetical protein